MIETDRLVIRKLNTRDTRDLIEIANDKELSLLTYYIPYPFGKNEAKKIINEENINKDLFRFAIELKTEGKIIGLIDLYNLKKAEGKIKFGYWIGKKYRRNGYATEGAREVIKFAFNELQARRIVAKVLDINEPSKKFIEKLGFKKFKRIANDKFLDGRRLDTISYELLK